MDSQVRAQLGEHIDRLGRIGNFSEGGYWRQPFSAADREAKELLTQWMAAAGMSVRQDNAGNLFGRLEGRDGGKVIMTGSHLDSVKSGGGLDGALGIMAGLSVAAGLRRARGQPDKPIEVVAICGEEQSRFRVPFIGSRAMVGQLGDKDLAVEDNDGVSLAAAIKAAGLDPARMDQARRDDVDCFLELHIEQGPVLEAKKLAVGAVTDIVGITQKRYTIIGDADHAGTTPMTMRKDALRGAVAVIDQVASICQRAGDACVATVGFIEAKPGGVSSVPASCAFSLDVRDKTLAIKQRILDEVEALVAKVTRERGLDYKVEIGTNIDPVPMAPHLVDIFDGAAKAAGISCQRMVSGAGHDAMIMARVAPAAMVFVPSKGGKSHSPKEHTSLDDIMPGIEVLYRGMERLAYR